MPFFFQGSMSQVTAEIESLKSQKLQIQEHVLNREKENMKLRIDEMKVKILDQQSSIAALHEEYEIAKEESKHLQEQVSILSGQLHEKEREISDLRGKLSDESVQQCSSRQEDKIKEEFDEQDQEFTVIKGEQGSFKVEKGSIATSSTAEMETLKAENSSLKDLQLLLEAKIQSMEKEIDVKNVEERFQVLQQENLKSCRQLASLKDHLVEVNPCTLSTASLVLALCQLHPSMW